MSIRREIGPMVKLALPLVLAELGWMTMGVVDTVMVGHLPRPAITISAVALGQVLYNTLAFGVGGVLLGLDTYISQAHGAGEWDDANRWLLSGVVLAGILSSLLMGMVWLGPLAMVRMPVGGGDAGREVMRQAVAFLSALNWGTLPLFLYMTFRRYLQAFNHVRPIAAAVVSANVVNAGLDWLLLYGHQWGRIGIPAYGVVGAAVSTALARVYLAAFVGAAVWWLDRRHAYGLRKGMNERRGWLDGQRLRRLVRLGAPVGGQIFVEIAIFAAVTAMIGTMGPVPLAGHEIALNCVSFTFMVPFAISAAATVRVGQAVGRGSATEAAAAGWTAIGLGAGFMATMAVVLTTMPARIAGGFTHDPVVIAAAVPLLLVGAAFQFFDGVQVTATGALRGVGNTHAGLVVQLIGYWVVGLPLGLWLGFHRKLGAVGLWVGLCAGLMIAGVSLITVWGRTVRRKDDRSLTRVSLVLLAMVLCAKCSMAAPAPVEGYKVVATYPHSTASYTEGFFYLNGLFYEGTGLVGRSAVLAIDPATGTVRQRHDLQPPYFGEGIVDWGPYVYEWTWQSHLCLVLDRFSMQVVKQFAYSGEGWGMTRTRKELITSDGTDTLRFRAPATFKETRHIVVKDDGRTVDNLNELEYIHGEIFANVWHSDRIARISPKDGHVIAWIDLTALLPANQKVDAESVLNGIAYDAQHDRIFVTGKQWPKIFEIKVVATR